MKSDVKKSLINVIIHLCAGDKIHENIFSSFSVHDDIANTGVQLKQNRISSSGDITLLMKRKKCFLPFPITSLWFKLGYILTLQTQGRSQKNVKINGF